MRILFLDPYHGGSHRAFSEGFAARSRHQVTVWSLPARKWKWRMQQAAWYFAERLQTIKAPLPDRILTTDMLNLAELKALLPDAMHQTPLYLYFHENQFSYPVGPKAPKIEFQWGIINAASALAANRIAFNSHYNLSDFFKKLHQGNRLAGESHLCEETLSKLKQRASVIPVGLDFEALDKAQCPKQTGIPLLLWNHRWEHDKNPESLFSALRTLIARGRAFEIAICGEGFRDQPACFRDAPQWLGNRLVAFGHQPLETYYRWLWRANAVISTANQEFLGLSVLEAMYCGAFPILPNRLSYPELLPEPLRAAHLYAQDDDLASAIEHFLLTPTTFTPKSSFLERYAWPQVTAALDRWLEAEIDEKSLSFSTKLGERATPFF